MPSTLQLILNIIASAAKEGVTTKELDTMAEAACRLHKVNAAFKGYKPKDFGGAEGYPATICTSINDEVIHGIPSNRELEEGDVLKIDLGIEQDGQFDDGAITVLVGEVDEFGNVQGSSRAARNLITGTKEALAAGVAAVKAGNTTHDIAKAIEDVAKHHRLHVIHGYGGHGIGEKLHMEPHVPNELDGSPAVPLVTGMRLAIEPMLATNHGHTQIMADGWTIKLRNGGLAAHFEETITVK